MRRREVPQRASWRQEDQSSVLEIPWLDLKRFESASITIVRIELRHRTGKVIYRQALRQRQKCATAFRGILHIIWLFGEKVLCNVHANNREWFFSHYRDF